MEIAEHGAEIGRAPQDAHLVVLPKLFAGDEDARPADGPGLEDGMAFLQEAEVNLEGPEDVG